MLDIAVFFFCAAGIYSIQQKASLPFSITTVNSNLIIAQSNSIPDLKNGQIIKSIDGISFNNWEEVELYLDGKGIGQTVNVLVNDGTHINSIKTSLISYYSFVELLIISFAGCVFIFFSILVRFKASENKSARLFHFASLGLAMVITMTAGSYVINPLKLGYLIRILWLAAYSVTPVLFIHFAVSFLKKDYELTKKLLIIFYLFSFINFLLLSYLFLEAAIGNVISGIGRYVFYYDTFFRVFQIICIVMAISVCIYAYKSTSDLEERKRLQWLLFGFFIGPFSFVLLWIIPIIILGHSLISETLVIVFLTAIPITFSIAIVKYHLMDINLLVRRSLVYSIILTSIILTYIALSGLITLFVSEFNPAFPSILTAIVVVFALQPVKNSVQKFVDKKFFRIEYDFRTEQRRFLDDIKNSLDVQSLANKIVNQTNALIPVDNIGFFLLSKPDNRIQMIANQGWEILKGRSLRFEEDKLKTDLSFPVAVDDKIEPGLKIETADLKVFKRWGMVLVFPVKSPAGVIHAFLALGEKKAGTRYLKDDVDLLNTVSTAAAIALDRLLIQEELLREKVEAERLEELNQMKSFFVSTVSHELKTPLTSIKMFTELLQNKLTSQNEKASEYLTIINGESDKLKRLIENILDFTKIEQGMKSYELGKVELNEIVCRVVKDIEYQVRMAKQTIITGNFKQKFYINADPNAVERAILNLITNAVKYSSPPASTHISIFSENNFVGVRVQDQGRGINQDKLDKIFEPFFRSDHEKTLKAEGTGLGLAIVKHIMDSHNGKIEVESEIDKGSIFTLWFPEVKDA